MKTIWDKLIDKFGSKEEVARKLGITNRYMNMLVKGTHKGGRFLLFKAKEVLDGN